MSVYEFSQYVNSAIQAGAAVDGTAVKVIADNGAEIGDVVYKVIQGGNGTATEVGIATQAAAGGTGLVATGLAYLAIDVGVAGAAIAPALGIAAGYGLYSLAPEFWTGVSNALMNAGKTVGGKIIAYWNGENTYYDNETIEIFKNALMETSIFLPKYQFPDVSENIVLNQSILQKTMYNAINKFVAQIAVDNGDFRLVDEIDIVYDGITYSIYNPIVICTGYHENNKVELWFSCDITNYLPNITTDLVVSFYFKSNGVEILGGAGRAVKYITCNGESKLLFFHNISYRNDEMAYTYYSDKVNSDALGYNYTNFMNVSFAAHFQGVDVNPNIQDNATLPTSDPFTTTFPLWTPLIYDPSLVPNPSEMPEIYPVKYPEIQPDPYPLQDPAQNPDPESVPDIYPAILPDFSLPSPNPNPEPQPEPDPDPQPEPDPIPEPDNPDTPNDPIDPNDNPPISPIVPLSNLPDTVDSSKLFTVYNPTGAQLDALGGYLWDSSLMAALRDIWQDPLDGIISLIQVFVTPTTGNNHNIILGFLDSGVSSAVVSSQFVTVDCGSVSVPETKFNATDYAPYTTLHLYLPFIGIVELDTQECMNADILVTYKVDVYTGTCLATVSVDRDVDMPNNPILYTYSGNCSQQLPLTSGNATGMLSALIGGITAGLSVASGGGLGVLAGTQIAGQSLAHEMFHVSHSGNISANAGIMGNKKPYLIIGRRHNYDANNYNALYGYPSNKTVILNNHTGYVKVKSCFLKTSATQPEHDEIMSLLRGGVIL